MAYYAQADGQVSATSTPIANPGAYNSVPVAAYPQAYSVSQQLPPAPGKYGASFERVTSIWLGTLLICLGVLSFSSAGLAFTYTAYYYELGTGLWCGAMFIAAGAVGIAAGVRGTDSLIKGVTASGVLTVAFATTQLTMAALGISHDEDGYDGSDSDYGPEGRAYALAANGLLTVGASLAIIFGIWLFAFGCSALCSLKTSAQVNPVHIIGLSNVPQHAPYEGTSNQQMLSVPVQYAQHPQQLTASNHQPSVVALRVTQTNEKNLEHPKYAEREDD